MTGFDYPFTRSEIINLPEYFTSALFEYKKNLLFWWGCRVP